MEGDPSDRLFYVDQGKIKITKQTPGRKEFILYFLQDGDIYGEIGDKNKVQHNCSAYVMEDSVIGILQQNDLEILLYRHLPLWRLSGRYLPHFIGRGGNSCMLLLNGEGLENEFSLKHERG